jgi:hypothetical protein
MVKSHPLKPPSSRGPGRSPFKAKTGVRISVGALAIKLITRSGGLFDSALVSALRPEPPEGDDIRISVGALAIKLITRSGGLFDSEGVGGFILSGHISHFQRLTLVSKLCKLITVIGTIRDGTPLQSKFLESYL